MKKAHKVIKHDYMDEELNAIALCWFILRLLSVSQKKRILSYLCERCTGDPIRWG